MLWRKSWLESRHLLLICLASVLLQFFLVQPGRMPGKPPRSLVPVDPSVAAKLTTDYATWVWVIWISRVSAFFITFSAALFASNGIVTHWCRGSTALYTLSLPVRRSRLLGARAIVGGLQHGIIALFACVLLPAASALTGRVFPLSDAVLYGVQMACGGLLFFGAAVLIGAAAPESMYRLIAYPLFGILGLAGMFANGLLLSPVFGVMTGRVYFATRTLPWLGMAGCVAAGALLILAAMRVIERKEY